MAESAKESRVKLGAVIKRRRVEAGLTQQELGEEAGYKGGAAVSILRVEKGSVSVDDKRLDAIATALRTTRWSLLREAAQSKAPYKGGAASLKERRITIEEKALHREKSLNTITDRYNRLVKRFGDEFAVPFVERCEALGVPASPEWNPKDEEPPAASESTAERVEWIKSQFAGRVAGAAAGAGVGAGVGGAGAAGIFAAVGVFGTASTGTAIGALSGIAATNATLAAIGGGSLAAGGLGIAGGTAILAGVVALPAVIAAGGVFALMHIKQQRTLETKIVQAEEWLEAAYKRYNAITTHLKEATAILETVTVHGTWLLNSWLDETADKRWEQLSEGAQRRYEALLTVMACVATLLACKVDLMAIAPDESAKFATLEEAETAITSSPEIADSRIAAELIRHEVGATLDELISRYEEVRDYSARTITDSLRP